ncbi:MAG: hypothetical protein QOF33_3520, partial [Thermomicrobiales bacterium]|nr:hypothetical protein [Thermomicrobiales bacterium]
MPSGQSIAGDRHAIGVVEPRITVASLYLDQEPVDDMGRALATRHGVPVYDSVGEALGL